MSTLANSIGKMSASNTPTSSTPLIAPPPKKMDIDNVLEMLSTLPGIENYSVSDMVKIKRHFIKDETETKVFM
jgi:hypothetical protein